MSLSLLAAAMLWAVQTSGTSTGSSSYSIQDSYRDAQAIVLGEISGGRSVDVGDKVQCRVSLRAERVIKGSITPGTDLTSIWEYPPSPHESPEVTSRVARAYGLWMLQANADGSFTPSRLGHAPGTMGGFFLPLPRVRPLAGLEYADTDGADVKLSRELAAVLETLANKAGDGLNQARVTIPDGGFSSRQTVAQAAFREVNSILSLTDAAAARPVYQRFAESELVNLRVVGVAGLLRGGDVSAVSLIERNAAQFSSTLEAMQLAPSVGSLDLKQHPEAMHSLGRSALSETMIPMLENMASMKLGWSGRWDMVPYLMAMLESPNGSTRGSALMGVCTAVRATGAPSELAGQWREEMSPYCFNRSPVNDPPREQAAVAFWRSWWTDQRARLRDVAFPEVHAPARYSAAPPAGATQAVEVSMEQRFRAHVRMTQSMNRSGAAPAPAQNPDDALLAATIRRVSEQLAETDERARQITKLAWRVSVPICSA